MVLIWCNTEKLLGSDHYNLSLRIGKMWWYKATLTKKIYPFFSKTFFLLKSYDKVLEFLSQHFPILYDKLPNKDNMILIWY